MIESEFYEDLDDLELTENFITHARRKRNGPREANPVAEIAHQRFVLEQDDTSAAVDFTYKAARFEEGWLLDSLDNLYEHQWIADVLRRVKGGKEANVYQCTAGAAVTSAYAAAKVYRPRSMRNLKNDHVYREGRTNLDLDGKAIIKERDLKAIRYRTEFGRDLLHQSWITYELTTLKTLHKAGADVPEPYASAPNAILMEFVGDGFAAAPALSEITLEREEAAPVFKRVMANIETMLGCGVIHGDLSAYNILYWEGNISLIDFPQVVKPEANINAYSIFQRDVTRVCDYFAKQGVRADGRDLAEKIWTSHGHRVRHEVHPSHLDAERPQDRAIWEKQGRGLYASVEAHATAAPMQVDGNPE
jgi:RIO kinase 1